jgi:hypothetical protein
MADLSDIMPAAFGALAGAAYSLAAVPSPSYDLTVFTPPIPTHTYVVGTDHALGVLGGDLDVACVMDLTEWRTSGRAVQVAELSCNLGAGFVRPLYGLLRLYNNAFLLGEQQGGGVGVMRTLWDELRYRNIYTHANPLQAVPTKGENPTLGWPARANDITVHNLRMAVVENRLELRSVELIRQMQALQFRGKAAPGDDRDMDDKLRLYLPGGGSPDRVRACAYALHALRVAQVLPQMNDRPPPPPELRRPDQPMRPPVAAFAPTVLS